MPRRSDPPAEPVPPSFPLPPGLDLLWGRRERGQRGPKPGLSLDAIVDAAVAIADADGLDAVSMARVAKELNFTTMSLYRYVSGKDQLLQLMWNASARGASDVVLEGEGWRARLRSWVLIQRDVIDSHPWITQMPMAAPPVAPNSLTFVERGLETLEGTGLADGDKLRLIGLLSSYTLSEARMANDTKRAAAAAAAAGAQAGAGWTFEMLLRQLVDEPTYPLLHRIAWTQDVGGGAAGASERAEFLFGVERILDGIQSFIDQTGSSG
ncbi:MAG: transcriptional regulator, TetR family [Frankiales bacterium]|nr:transcriptional regulator, TetR family [Frankiales bacterium]